ncbi:MAG: trypsin-like peptidase domain-containing protein, partial [Rhodoferax sp.]|nr:trypsin-like peptidase domain-containing protein [Rhodoferax sp.]
MTQPQTLRRRGAVLATAALMSWAALAPASVQAQAATPVVQLPDFTELVERVGPAVVNIRTLERPGNGGGNLRGQVPPEFEEFLRRFGIPLPNRPDRGGPRNGPQDDEDNEPQQRGVGSGFVLSADGYIMTNAHVVDGADEVIVTLTDKRELKAKIVGADRRTDVAVVKVEATGLPFVRIGDANRLKVGEWVLA